MNSRGYIFCIATALWPYASAIIVCIVFVYVHIHEKSVINELLFQTKRQILFVFFHVPLIYTMDVHGPWCQKTHIGLYGLRGLSIGVMIFILYKLIFISPYPKPTPHTKLAFLHFQKNLIF